MDLKKKLPLILVLCMILITGMSQFSYAGTGDAATGYVYQHDDNLYYQNRSPHRYTYSDSDGTHDGYAAATYRLLSGENNSTVNVAYCCDLKTSVEPGTYYKRVNLEEADYYSADAAKHIRAILNNGYWSTGSENTRSIDALASAAGATNLTNAEALLATQEAIWHYANSSEAGGARITNNYSYTYPANNGDHNGRIADTSTVNVTESASSHTASNITKVYNHLISLPGEDASSVIWNFTDNGYIVIAGSDSSTYDLIVHFDMAGTSSETEGLNVTVTPKFESALGLIGDILAPLTGGSNVDAVTIPLDSMTKTNNGYEVRFTGLTESQVSSLSGINVTLDGTQNLGDDVFFYEPEGGRDIAQSFVGLASGLTKVHREWNVAVLNGDDDDDIVVSDDDKKALTIVKYDSIVKGSDELSDTSGYICINGEEGKDAEYALPVKDAEFQLYAKDSQGNVTAIGSPVKSDEYGNVVWNLTDTGSEYSYYACETSSPDGFVTPSSDNAIYFDTTDTVYMSNERETKKVQVIKEWDDDNNRDGLRPDSVTMEILANGESTGMIAQLTEENDWTSDKWDAPVTDVNGNEIIYTCEETTLAPGDGYTATVDTNDDGAFVVTNAHDPYRKDISVEKIWIDGDNHKKIRPDKINVQLMANGVACGDAVTLDESNNWSYKWENLYEFENGEPIEYTVEETSVNGYTSSVKEINLSSEAAPDQPASETSDQSFVITNTIQQEKTSLSGTKTWVDPEGTEHPDVVITLLCNGEETDKTATLKDGDTEYSFTDLDKYDEYGFPYTYSIKEAKVEGYSPSYATVNSNTINITNTVDQEYISVNGEKTWIDPEGTEHPDITITLYRDDEQCGNPVVLSDGETVYNFADLPKYDLNDGHEYEYTVREDEVEGYNSDIDGFNIINTIEQKKTSISGTKTWKDPAGTVHPDITITLYRDGKEFSKQVLKDGDTSYSFNNLDVYDLDDGHEYQYAVSESSVENYTSQQEGNNFINTISEGQTTISGNKTWIDPEGTKHPNVTVILLQNGDKYDSKELKDGETSYEFDVPLYDSEGQPYTYTIKESNVNGYTSSIDGYNLINTIEQEEVLIMGSKDWNVPEGADVPSVTVNLLRDGETIDSTVIKSGSREYEFAGLDKYDLTDGHEYRYTVQEAESEGYSDSYKDSTIVNTVNQQILSVSGTKVWIAPEGTEHPDITVVLNKNGQPFQRQVLTNGEVDYTFDELEAYEFTPDGKVIENVYTITEEPVEGYTSQVNGYNLVNVSDEMSKYGYGNNDEDNDGNNGLLKTGDVMSIIFLAVIALTALAGAAYVVISRRRNA